MYNHLEFGHSTPLHSVKQNKHKSHDLQSGIKQEIHIKFSGKLSCKASLTEKEMGN
jgi:hypothetical protein